MNIGLVRWLPVIEGYVKRLESLTVKEIENMDNKDFVLHLTSLGISPYKLEQLLKELGYESYSNHENGWQIDFWISMKRTDNKSFPSMCERLCIYGCAVTSALQLYPDDSLNIC